MMWAEGRVEERRSGRAEWMKRRRE